MNGCCARRGDTGEDEGEEEEDEEGGPSKEAEEASLSRFSRALCRERNFEYDTVSRFELGRGTGRSK